MVNSAQDEPIKEAPNKSVIAAPSLWGLYGRGNPGL